jgi:hypothetical protein
MTNRTFDSRHNTVNQLVATYTSSDASTPFEVQEIRSSGFLSSGVARAQVVATYADLLKTMLIDVKIIENEVVDSQGNVYRSVITRYADCDIANDGTGDITPTAGTEIDRQTINVVDVDPADSYSNLFDARGNALQQRIVKESWDSVAGGLVYTEAQTVINSGYDIHDRVGGSVIRKYAVNTVGTIGTFLERQDISYSNYDEWGNAGFTAISRYGDTAATDELDYKEITSSYEPDADRDDTYRWRAKGLASYSSVLTYDKKATSAESPRSLIEEQNITYLAYDIYGNALEQETVRKVAGAAVETKVMESEYATRGAGVEQFRQTLAGRARTSTVTTRTPSGVFVETQVVEYLSYDELGNVLGQSITRKNEDGDIIDFKTISSTYSGINGYMGLADSSTIETFAFEDGPSIEKQVIEYDSYDSYGNATIQKIARYGTIFTESVSVAQLIGGIRVYDIVEEEVLLDYKVVLNSYSGVNQYKGYADQSIIFTYSDTGGAATEGAFVEAQVITYDSTRYDAYGNSLKQSISRYSGGGYTVSESGLVTTQFGELVDKR